MEEPEFITHFLKYYTEMQLICGFTGENAKECDDPLLMIPNFRSAMPPHLYQLRAVVCHNAANGGYYYTQTVETTTHGALRLLERNDQTVYQV